uniref:Uncharacterized protein n=1 Tax=Knipowitschia caucasica TaxID=637954 RepID=A0AAV2KXW6_KNICA
MLQHVTSPAYIFNGSLLLCPRDILQLPLAPRCRRTCASSGVQTKTEGDRRLNLVSRRHVVEVIHGELHGRQVLQILSSEQQRRTTARDGYAREIHHEGYCLRGRHQKVYNDNTTGHT